MKKILSVLPVALFFQAAVSQQPQPVFLNNPFPKTITVSGSAEMEVVPDEIYVNIELREYQKKGEPRKDLETIKTRFLESCKTAGIPDSAVSIVSYSGYNNYYSIRKKKKNADLFANIVYQVKFKNSKLMDNLVEQLDDDATQSFSIVSASHSQITEFRKQLKIKAIQAAKDKGIYLTEAIGEKLGEAVTINEPAEWQPFYYENALVSNANYSAFAANENKDNDPSKEVDFKKIKLRFEVTVIFTLK
jgi:uncharacterized protein